MYTLYRVLYSVLECIMYNHKRPSYIPPTVPWGLNTYVSYCEPCNLVWLAPCNLSRTNGLLNRLLLVTLYRWMKALHGKGVDGS